MTKKIYIVTHKSYQFPLDTVYMPIKVGSGELKNIKLNDSNGDSICHLNSSFCELTALYWIWKNDTSDIIGLMHYRRYFTPKNKFSLVKNKKIASSDDFSFSDRGVDIFVAKPRNYYIFSVKNHYCKAHYANDYEQLRRVVELQSPEYLDSFDKVMNSSRLSLYNMFVAKREIIEPYLEWLFNILFTLEKKIPYQEYDNYQKRVFGFMAERLFNVWLEFNKNTLNIEYRKVVNIEGENLFKKGLGLLKRHVIGK